LLLAKASIFNDSIAELLCYWFSKTKKYRYIQIQVCNCYCWIIILFDVHDLFLHKNFGNNLSKTNSFMLLIFKSLTMRICIALLFLFPKWKTPGMMKNILVIIGFAISNLYSCQANEKAGMEMESENKDSLIHAVSNETTTRDSISIIGVGDIMMGTLYPYNPAYLPPGNNCSILFSEVQDILQSADLCFGNLEGCFLDEGQVVKKCSDPSRCYAFRMPEKYVHCLKDAGFDVLSLANNHIGDFGAAGRNRTVSVLKENGLFYAGLISKPWDTFTIEGVRYGFCAFAPNTGCVDLRNTAGAKAIVSELDKTCDIVIVSFHGGAEGAAHQHVKKQTEYFYGENRGNVYAFAHEMIDAGADIVFGHGPHVTRAIDVYKERFIAYSLGNFCTYSRFSLQGVNAIAPIIKVYTDKNGAFLRAQIYPVYQQKYQGGPKPDPQKRAISIIRDLTFHDLLELKGKLSIDDDGWVEYP
jgi:hypothetical protein